MPRPFSSNFMAVEQMMGDEMPAEVAAPETEATEETVSLPASLLAGKSVTPGDVVRLEVVSVDDDGASVTVKYAAEPVAEEPAESVGLEGMAAEFD